MKKLPRIILTMFIFVIFLSSCMNKIDIAEDKRKFAAEIQVYIKTILPDFSKLVFELTESSFASVEIAEKNRIISNYEMNVMKNRYSVPDDYHNTLRYLEVLSHFEKTITDSVKVGLYNQKIELSEDVVNSEQDKSNYQKVVQLRTTIEKIIGGIAWKFYWKNIDTKIKLNDAINNFQVSKTKLEELMES